MAPSELRTATFSELGVRFGWTPWRNGDEGGEQRAFDVSHIEPVRWPHRRWPAWGHRKPCGGLWLSPLVSDAPLTSCWSRWCEEYDVPHGPTVEVALTDEARICVLESVSDVEQLATTFPARTAPPDAGFTEPAVDWSALGEHVDAIYMSERAENGTKALLTPHPRTASGWWEIPSMLVYRREVVLEG